VKSFWPKARLEVLAQGAAADCSEEQFNEYLLEARPVDEKIVESVIQDRDIVKTSTLLPVIYLSMLSVQSLPYDFWIVILVHRLSSRHYPGCNDPGVSRYSSSCEPVQRVR
jgi:hypothetical protein